MQYALENFEFEYLIGLDTDALIIGFGLIEKIQKYFENHKKKIGHIGSYKIRADGRKRSRWQWGIYIIFLAYIKSFISPDSTVFREWLRKARQNGYKYGEHIIFGAYVFKYKCLQRIIHLFPYDIMLGNKLYLSRLGDDVLFGLLTFAAGYSLGDFGRPIDPFAIAHNYLPISKEALIEGDKKVIHSIKKGLDGENEDQLRCFFRKLRK